MAPLKILCGPLALISVVDRTEGLSTSNPGGSLIIIIVELFNIRSTDDAIVLMGQLQLSYPHMDE